jgi:hypothetical protein
MKKNRKQGPQMQQNEIPKYEHVLGSHQLRRQRKSYREIQSTGEICQGVESEIEGSPYPDDMRIACGICWHYQGWLSLPSTMSGSTFGICSWYLHPIGRSQSFRIHELHVCLFPSVRRHYLVDRVFSPII